MDHGWYTDDILVGGLEHEWINFRYILGMSSSQRRWLNHPPDSY